MSQKNLSQKRDTKFLLFSLKIVLLTAFLLSASAPNLLSTIIAEELESTNYRIIDSEIDSGGGVSDSTSYSLLGSVGNPTGDARIESGSYSLGAGFPSGIQANVPLVRCFETDTNSGTTNCTDFPNANGALGECGDPGCYNRAKIEIDPQNNPIDALFLVSVVDNSTGNQFYLQSDNTIDVGANTDISDYRTICQIQGKDDRAGSGCEISSDPDWDESLQSTNIFGLDPDTSYTVSARALNGDFTETGWSPELTTSTLFPALEMAIDTGTTSAAVNNPPYTIDFGTITTGVVETATDLGWIKIGTNAATGSNLYAKDINNGLSNGSTTIPSQTEDLNADPGGDGGFGLQIDGADVTQASLGPIVITPQFTPTNPDDVGSVSTTDTLVASTSNSGSNRSELNDGVIGITFKSKFPTGTESGLYQDTVTFTYLADF